jgi:DnaJ-class molecular chaperone
MSAALAERLRPRSRSTRSRGVRHTPLAAGGRITLDELVSGAWAGLAAGAPVACPVCDDRMDPAGSAQGACRACGATLS